MTKLSPLLKEKLKLANPGEELVHLVIEADEKKAEYVLSQLEEAGFKVDRSKVATILGKTYIPAIVPAKLVTEVAKIEGVKMVHKSMPRAMGGMTTAKIPFFSSVMDELIGQVRIPAVEAPTAAFMEAFPNPVTPLKAVGNLAVPLTGVNPMVNVKIFPTSETFKIVKGDVKTKKGEGVAVAILDTGSPRFTTQFLPPFKALSLVEHTVIPEPPFDMQGHGSWCHDTVCGDPAPSPYGTLVGGAPKVSKSAHIKALNTFPGAGTTEGILKAIEIAVNEVGPRGIISMSLGGPCQGPSVGPDADLECKVVNDLAVLEYIFVIAAGNSGSGLFTCGSPGAAERAVTVGSVSIMDSFKPAVWSSRLQSDWYGEHKKEFARDLAKYGDRLICPDLGSLGGGRASAGASPDEIIWSGETGWFESFYDGIKDGTGGMHGCILEGERVVKNPGSPVPIENINPGDWVYTYDNNGGITPRRVLNTIFSGVKPVYKVKFSDREVSVTEEHPFLTIERIDRRYLKEQAKRLREEGLTQKEIAERLNVSRGTIEGWFTYDCNPRTQYRLRWKELRELKPGDVVVCLKEIPDGGSWTVDGMEFDKNLVRLFGFLIGDGWITQDTLYIAASDNEAINRIYTELIKEVFDLDTSPHFDKEGRIVAYRGTSKKICTKLRKLGLDKHAKEKYVPEWVFKLPKEGKEEFIEGYIDADGARVKHGPTLQYEVEASSKQLVDDLHFLILILGWKVSKLQNRERITQPPHSPEPINAKSWYFTFHKTKFRYGNWKMKRGYGLGLDLEHFVYREIKGIEPLDERRTYDLEIEDSHNFIAEGVIVHNTSQATPHAAALIACLVSDGIVKNDLDVKKYLRETKGGNIIPDPVNTEEDNKYIAKYGKSGATGFGLMTLKRYKR